MFLGRTTSSSRIARAEYDAWRNVGWFQTPKCVEHFVKTPENYSVRPSCCRTEMTARRAARRKRNAFRSDRVNWHDVEYCRLAPGYVRKTRQKLAGRSCPRSNLRKGRPWNPSSFRIKLFEYFLGIFFAFRTRKKKKTSIFPNFVCVVFDYNISQPPRVSKLKFFFSATSF